jgi:hypothetical protein
VIDQREQGIDQFVATLQPGHLEKIVITPPIVLHDQQVLIEEATDLREQQIVQFEKIVNSTRRNDLHAKSANIVELQSQHEKSVTQFHLKRERHQAQLVPRKPLPQIAQQKKLHACRLKNDNRLKQRERKSAQLNQQHLLAPVHLQLVKRQPLAPNE